MTGRSLTLALALSLLTARPAAAQSQDQSDPSTPPARPARAGSPLQRIPRITAELVLGGASAAVMAYGGFQLGCALDGSSLTPSSDCGRAGLYGLVSGFAVGVPVGVMLGGSLLDGDGTLLPTLFGTGFGMAAVFGGLVFLQRSAPEIDPTPLVLIPLVFAVVGYELSSHHSRTASQAEARGKRLSLRIAPSASFTREGAALGVLMVLP